MKSFSVIIPARNAAKTLGICLQAVFSSSLSPAEILVADDGSTDSTVAVAQQYRCRILKTNFGKGPMQPRFEGARNAVHSLLIFIDADVCVAPDTFERILKNFEGPAVSAVTGILSREPGVDDFFSTFKNEYMHFIFKKQPRLSTFLYGSLWAVRKKDLLYFDPISEPFGSLVSDSEMGLRLSSAGKTVLLDHQLEVRHLKKYSLTGILRNDFVIPFMFSQMFCKYGQPSSILGGKGFSHARTGQVLGTMISFLSLATLVLVLMIPCCQTILLFAALLGIWVVWFYWRSFIISLFKNRGPLFTFATMLFLPLDQAVMFTGMGAGFVYVFLKKIRAWFLPEQFQPPPTAPAGVPAAETDVILLSFQQAPFLKEALESVLHQTYQNFRMIAVDDGSKDASLGILKNYEERYPDQIRVWTHPGHHNLGIVASYKLGLSKATAEFIAFLEADDLWEPDNLQKKILALKSSPEAGVVYSSCRPFGEGLAVIYWKLHGIFNNAGIPRHRPFDNFKTLLERNNVSSFSHFAARRSLLNDIPLPSDHGDRLDWWILAQLSIRSLFIYLPRKLCRWRIHSGSVSYKLWGKDGFKRFNRFLLDLYASLGKQLQHFEVSVENAINKQALDSALRDQEFIRQTGSWFHPRRFCRHPKQFLRFLLHYLLRNLLI